MKVLIDVKDNKADFMMELLQSFSFVKAEQISASEARFFLKEFKQAGDEVNLAKQGKVKPKTAEQLLVRYNNDVTAFFEKQTNACFRDCPFKVQQK
jgi:hypothetical protein